MLFSTLRCTTATCTRFGPSSWPNQDQLLSRRPSPGSPTGTKGPAEPGLKGYFPPVTQLLPTWSVRKLNLSSQIAFHTTISDIISNGSWKILRIRDHCLHRDHNWSVITLDQSSASKADTLIPLVINPRRLIDHRTSNRRINTKIW